jgi:MATE family multidrug resistance protein
MDTAPTSPARPGARDGRWNARVWRLAGPIILSNISTPLLGAVDTAVMGHLPDPAYIGAVALGAVVFNFLFWGFSFLRMGTTGFTSQAYGAGDTAELRAALVRPLVMAVGLGAALIVLQAPIGWLALRLLDASAGVEGLTHDYYAIRIWSAPFALINYALLGWLLGTQRAYAVLLLQVVLNGTNIALDLLFVVGFGWGIEGVAGASLLAEMAATLLGLSLVARTLFRSQAPLDWAQVAARDRLLALFRVNVNILIRTLCLMTAFAYFAAQGAQMGDLILAANAVLMQFLYIIAYGLDGFSHAAEVLAGSALGAGSRHAFRQAVKVSTLWALGMALLAGLLVQVAGEPFIALISDIPEVRTTAAVYLPWMVVSPVISVWSFLLDGIFIGTTRTVEMRNAMIASLAVYLVASWLLVPALGNHGLWLALMIFMVARALSLGAYYPRIERGIAGD